MCDLLECRDCKHQCKDDITNNELEKLYDLFLSVPRDANNCIIENFEGWEKGVKADYILCWFKEHYDGDLSDIIVL